MATVVGVIVGFVVRGTLASQAMKEADEKAALIVEKARSQQKDLILEAKDEKLRLQREAEDEARAKRNELANLERRLLQRDEQLDQRADMLEQRDRKLMDRERELDTAREELARPTRSRSRRSSGSAACRAEDAKAILLEAVREEAEHDAVRLGRVDRAAGPRGGPGEGPRRHRHRDPAGRRRSHRRAHRQRRPPARATR